MGSKIKKTRTRIKIVSATATAVFSLASVFAGTYAWFSANGSVTANGMQVSAAMVEGAILNSIKLIKFDYSIDQFGLTDYLHPGDGAVNDYNYDKTTNTFGYYEEDQWVSVRTMNIYDPIESIVSGGQLDTLNCNAIYEANFTTNSNSNYLTLSAKKYIDGTHSPDESNGEISLANHADFDVFFEPDVNIQEDDTYSNSSPYSIGDYVIYEGSIYKCIDNVSSGREAFEADKWELTTFDSYSTSLDYPANSIVFFDGFIYICPNSIIVRDEVFESEWDQISAFNESLPYAKGALVEHGGNLYICTANEGVEAGSWTGTGWSNSVASTAYVSGSTYSTDSIVSKDGHFYIRNGSTGVNSFNENKWNKYNTYSNSSSYDVGAVVFHDGLVYICTTAIGEGGENPFDDSHWSDSFCNKAYFPNKYHPNPTKVNERLYHKISKLATESTHSHFYADSYDSTNINSYQVGDLVSKMNFLYKSKTAISAPDEGSSNVFDNNEWDFVSSWSNYSPLSSYSEGDIIKYADYFYVCGSAGVPAPEEGEENVFDPTLWSLINDYSSTSAYAQNTYVSYDKVIYECTSSVDQSVEWNEGGKYWKRSNTPTQISLINDQSVSADQNGNIKIYINVNYSPSQSDSYAVNLNDNIVAINDFYFNFLFTTSLGGNS